MKEMKNPVSGYKLGNNPISKDSHGKKDEVMGRKSVLKKILGGIKRQ